MTYLGKVDQDAVLRARTVLLGSGDISLSQQIWAHRVLAEASPAVNLPKLAQALLRYGYQEVGDQPELESAVFAEAVDSARRMDGSDRRRGDLLLRALMAHQRQLFVLGRRAEGLSACVEMAEVGRSEFEAGRATHPLHGQERLAAVLAEDGRHDEAAVMFGERVAVERAEEPKGDLPFWSTVAWATELEAAGEHDAAVDAFGGIVGATRDRLADGGTSLAIMVWESIAYSQALESRGRPDEARSAWHEAVALVEELAGSGERTSWSNIQSWWAALLGLSGQAAEISATALPRPAFGLPTFSWSPDVKDAYFDGRAALEAAVAALAPLADRDPQRHLADLVALHRRLTICSALYWQSRTFRILEPLRPLFDEGVRLARRLADLGEGRGIGALVRALTDRSAFLIAVQVYSEALTDFREATILAG